MNWGDAPGWVGLVVAVGALLMSEKTRRDGNKSAERAKESADRSAVAAERSAAAAEATLLDQRHAATEAARPRAEFELERPGKNLFLLRNVGTATAEDVTVTRAGEPGQGRDLPEGETMAPSQGCEFMMVAAMGLPMPTEIYVTWDGQSDEVALPVPPW